MSQKVYTGIRCYQSFLDLLSVPFSQDGGFDRFFDSWLSGAPYVKTSRGRDALSMALIHLKDSLGARRVLISAYICKDAVSAVMKSGLEVEIVDSDPNTLGPDMSSVSVKEGDIIINTNLYGLRSPIKKPDGVRCFLIDDNAQSFLPPLKSADFTLYSFEKGKDMSGARGGLITSSSGYDDFFQNVSIRQRHTGIGTEVSRYLLYMSWKIRSIPWLNAAGKSVKGRYQPPDANLTPSIPEMDIEVDRMSRISERVVAKELARLDAHSMACKEIHRAISSRVSKAAPDGFEILIPPEDSQFFSLVAMSEKRDELVKHLNERKIFATVPWGYTVKGLSERSGEMKGAEKILENILHVKLDPSWGIKDAEYIADEILVGLNGK